jgi:hypothetical protein
LEEQTAVTRRRKQRITQVADETSQLIDSLAASGDPYVRVVGIIAPRRVGH